MKMLTALPAILVLLSACAAPGQPAPSPTTTPVPSPEPTISPEPDAEAQIERAIELRRDWGLSADREWVLAVAQDPAALMSELGIPVTAEEAAQLQRMFREDPRSRLIAYGAAQPDEFGGLYVEGAGVVMLFTRNLEMHRRSVKALAPGMEIDVRESRFSERELRDLMDELSSSLLRQPPGADFQFLSLSVDTINNIVQLEAKSSNPAVKDELEALHEGMLLVNIHPLPGPWQNVAEGDGWRLLAAGTARSEGYVVRVATDDATWRQLWPQLDPVNDRPEADLSSEIVVSFGHGIGSSCPEMRLDDVVIDHERAIIYSLASDPLQPRGCTADLVGGAFFVIALQRDALPAGPFTVQLRQDGIGGEEASIQVDLGR